MVAVQFICAHDEESIMKSRSLLWSETTDLLCARGGGGRPPCCIPSFFSVAAASTTSGVPRALRECPQLLHRDEQPRVEASIDSGLDPASPHAFHSTVAHLGELTFIAQPPEWDEFTGRSGFSQQEQLAIRSQQFPPQPFCFFQKEHV